MSYTFYLNQIKNNFPDKIQVEILNDSFWTNLLLIISIFTTVITSFFVGRYIQKKIKEYEVKAHRDKIITEEKIDFCKKTYRLFKSICIKNPKDISDKDIQRINNLKISEKTIFIDQKLITQINDFGDYIINVKQTSSLKDFNTEKYFFYNLKKSLKE